MMLILGVSLWTRPSKHCSVRRNGCNGCRLQRFFALTQDGTINGMINLSHRQSSQWQQLAFSQVCRTHFENDDTKHVRTTLSAQTITGALLFSFYQYIHLLRPITQEQSGEPERKERSPPKREKTFSFAIIFVAKRFSLLFHAPCI